MVPHPVRKADQESLNCAFLLHSLYLGTILLIDMRPAIDCTLTKVCFDNALEHRSPQGIRAAADHLLALEAVGLSYSSCVATLSSARDIALGELASFPSITERRWRRSHIREAFHLIRDELQYRRGRPRHRLPVVRRGRVMGAFAPSAFVDGSLRKDRAQIGFQVLGHDGLWVEGSMVVDARDPTECELAGLFYALRTVAALRMREVRVFTDAEALLALFGARSRLAQTDMGRSVLNLVAALESFEIAKIPRLFNHGADRLASGDMESPAALAGRQ